MPVAVEVKVTIWPESGEAGEKLNEAAGACARAAAGMSAAARSRVAKTSIILPAGLGLGLPSANPGVTSKPTSGDDASRRSYHPRTRGARRSDAAGRAVGDADLLSAA